MAKIRVLYITNVPKPDEAELDAHFQELDLLCDRFNGQVLSAFPFSKPSSFVPRTLYGLHNLSIIKKAAKKANVVHIFSPVYFDYRYIKKIANYRAVYSTMTPLTHPAKPIKSIKDYIFYDEKSVKKFTLNSTIDVRLAPPFVQMKKTNLPVPTLPFTLLMASAPWEESQFLSKGVYMLLELLKEIPELHIIFLWRNILKNKMTKLVEQSPCKNRIQLINERVNVVDYINQSHAVVLLSQYTSLVKSYPHSLMEGLLSGRPVITSPTIPMCKEVEKNQYGVVLEEFTLDSLKKAVAYLINNYTLFRNATTKLPANRFDKSQFITLHENIYEQILKRKI